MKLNLIIVFIFGLRNNMILMSNEYELFRNNCMTYICYFLDKIISTI